MLHPDVFIILSTGKVPGIKSSGQNLLEFFGIIIVFIIVLVACWATTRFVASKKLAGRSMGNFEVVETYMISRDKFLQLIRIGKKYYVISISKDNVSLITEVQEEEIVVNKSTGSASVTGFADILSSIVKKRSEKEPSDNDDLK